MPAREMWRSGGGLLEQAPAEESKECTLLLQLEAHAAIESSPKGWSDCTAQAQAHRECEGGRSSPGRKGMDLDVHTAAQVEGRQENETTRRRDKGDARCPEERRGKEVRGVEWRGEKQSDSPRRVRGRCS